MCFFAPLLFGFGLLLAVPASAEEPLLTITGDLAGGAPVVFDHAALEALGVVELETTTPWTEGRRRFSGVLMRDVLAAAGAQGKEIRAVALNDYFNMIPISDFEDYRVIVAFAMDGERLTLRDKGPLWIVYPRSDHSELRQRKIDHRMVWQLYRIEVF